MAAVRQHPVFGWDVARVESDSHEKWQANSQNRHTYVLLHSAIKSLERMNLIAELAMAGTLEPRTTA